MKKDFQPTAAADSEDSFSSSVPAGEYNTATRDGGWDSPRRAQKLVEPYIEHNTLVLDIGTGTGQAAAGYTDKGAMVVALDRDPAMLEAAQQTIGDKGVYRVADINAELPIRDIAGNVDVAQAIGVCEFAKDLDGVIGQVEHALNIGGKFVFTVEELGADGAASQHFPDADVTVYRHNREEVERLLMQHGFDLLFEEAYDGYDRSDTEAVPYHMYLAEKTGVKYELAPFDKLLRDAPDRAAQERRFFAMDFIRNRNPEDIAANAIVATREIERLYLENHYDKSRFGKKIALRSLHKKARAFQDAFDERVFGRVESAVPSEIDLSDNAELQSADMRATIAGKDWQFVNGLHQGYLDAAIGNTDYVFANAEPLKSYTGYTSRNVYNITSQDGYVTPVDILYTIPVNSVNNDYEGSQLDLYARNIYSIPDFKKVFALYNAALFDSPEDAIGFARAFRHAVPYGKWGEGDAVPEWSPREVYDKFTEQDAHGTHVLRSNSKVASIAWRMKQLAARGVYPPLEPEFQFRGSVMAHKKR